MKKVPILWHMFIHQYLDFLISPLYPAPIQKFSGLFFLFPNVYGETCTAILSVFFGFQPKNNYLFAELSFLDSFWYKPE